MEDLVIRDLAAADLRPLIALYAHLHREDDPLPPWPDVERTWQGIVADPCQIYLGAFIGSQLASACNAAIVPNLTRGARPYGVIENVVTLSTTPSASTERRSRRS